MPLVSMKHLLPIARSQGYAIGAFNPVDYLTVKAGVRAAEEMDAPIILQTSVKTVKYWGHETIAGWMRELAGPSPVPVSFHLDHCKEPDFIQHCLEAGWTDVMIDASSLPYEENLSVSRRVCEMATPYGAGVEAELGEIGGVEEDIAVAEEDAHLADPEKAARFCGELDLAVFAPAIGTAHGVYKGEPKIAFSRLETMFQTIPVPFALHGGTGLSDDVFHRCIALGCAKVNISTELKHCFIDSFCRFHGDDPTNYEPLKAIEAQYQCVKEMIAAKIALFGGAGKASGMKAGKS